MKADEFGRKVSGAPLGAACSDLPQFLEEAFHYLKKRGVLCFVQPFDMNMYHLDDQDSLRRYCADPEGFEAELHGCSVDELRRYRISPEIPCGAITGEGSRCKIPVGIARSPRELADRDGEFCGLHALTSTASYQHYRRRR